MPDPIVFISHSRVVSGRLHDIREMSVQVFPMLESSKPDTVLHHGYLSADESIVSFVHVFPGADAMDAHFEGGEERAGAAAEVMQTLRFEIFGTPSEAAVAMLRQVPGVELVVNPTSIGGYMRLTSG